MAYDDSTRTGNDIKRLAIDANLLLLLAYAIITIAVAFLPLAELTPIASFLGIGMVLFVPGYALVAALLTRKKAIGGLERVALSSGLSLMTAGLAGTALYFSPFGFSPGLLSVCLAAFTIACMIVAMRRRPSPGHRGNAGAGFPEVMKRITAAGRLNLALAVVLTLALLASVSFLSYAVLVPKQGDAFTEFYVLGPDGKAGDYPARLHPGDTAPVIVGIVNHERIDRAYDLVVLLNDSVNVSRLYQENVTLANGLTWEKKIDLKPELTGTDLKIELLLYADGNYTVPYRDLHLFVSVTQPLY